MITTDTLLILGAGASASYGYPTGDVLVQKICQISDSQANSFLGADEESLWPEFLDRLRRVRGVTIDYFLFQNSRFDSIGKKAIAHVLLNVDRRNSDDEDDWYAYLWSRLVDGVEKPEGLIENTVKVITFNYDRSLEFFLRDSCRSLFGSTNSVPDLCKHLWIKHVYGTLDDDSQKPASPSTVRSSGLSIRTIYEARNDPSMLEEISRAVREARRVIFLGFGFHDENLKLLGADQNPSPFTEAHVLSSGYKLTLEERKAFSRKLMGYGYKQIDGGFLYDPDLGFGDRKCRKFLRESGALL